MLIFCVETLTNSVLLNNSCNSLNGFVHSAKFNFFTCSFDISAAATLFRRPFISSCEFLSFLPFSSAFFLSSSSFFSSVILSIFELHILFISSERYEISGKVNSISNLNKLFIQYCTCLSIQFISIFCIHCCNHQRSLFFTSFAHFICTPLISIHESQSLKSEPMGS
jgi:hypothetical protein